MMNNTDSNTTDNLWKMPLEEALPQMLSMLRENGVASVCIDCNTMQIELKKSESGSELISDISDMQYFRNMYDVYGSQIDSEQIVNEWMENDMRGDLNRLVSKELNSLLKSEFIIINEYDLDEEDVSNLKDEMVALNITQHEKKESYAMLRMLVQKVGERFVFHDTEKIGRYIKTRSENLTKDSIKRFFRFMKICQTVEQIKADILLSGKQSELQKHFRKVREELELLADCVNPKYKDVYYMLWEQVLTHMPQVAEVFLKVAPNGFADGYNQKLVCNIVGLFTDLKLYTQPKKNLENKIYTGKTTYSYINNYYPAGGTDSVLTKGMIEDIKRLFKDNTPG